MKTTDPFQEFLATFGTYLEASRRVAEIDREVNDEVADLVEERQDEYNTHLAAARQAEEALKEYARLHPEWFQGKKTLTVAQGSIAKRSATKIECADADRTVALIKIRLKGKAETFIHRVEKPNLETLALLSDAALARLGAKRVSTENLTVKPAKVELGKTAVAEPEEVAA